MNTNIFDTLKRHQNSNNTVISIYLASLNCFQKLDISQTDSQTLTTKRQLVLAKHSRCGLIMSCWGHFEKSKANSSLCSGEQLSYVGILWSSWLLTMALWTGSWSSWQTKCLEEFCYGTPFKFSIILGSSVPKATTWRSSTRSPPSFRCPELIQRRHRASRNRTRAHPDHQKPSTTLDGASAGALVLFLASDWKAEVLPKHELFYNTNTNTNTNTYNTKYGNKDSGFKRRLIYKSVEKYESVTRKCELKKTMVLEEK